jgi:type IV pilus assembly protein PilE
MTSGKQKVDGFTLIEAMITAAVIALLATIAYPSYSRTMIKVRRSDAHESLMKAVALQEQYYVDNKRYATKMSELGYLDKAGSPTDAPLSREGNYTITVSASTATTFTLRAAPVSGGPQAKDTYCDKLTITDKGIKGKTGTASVATCW